MAVFQPQLAATRSRSANNNFATIQSLIELESEQSILGCLNHDTFDSFQTKLFQSLQTANDYSVRNFFHINSTQLYKFIITLYIASLDESNPERSSNKKEASLLDRFQNELNGNSDILPLNIASSVCDETDIEYDTDRTEYIINSPLSIKSIDKSVSAPSLFVESINIKSDKMLKIKHDGIPLFKDNELQHEIFSIITEKDTIIPGAYINDKCVYLEPYNAYCDIINVEQITLNDSNQNENKQNKQNKSKKKRKSKRLGFGFHKKNAKTIEHVDLSVTENGIPKTEPLSIESCVSPPPFQLPLAKPSDYDEIEIKAVDPLDYKRGMRKNGKSYRNTNKYQQQKLVMPSSSILASVAIKQSASSIPRKPPKIPKMNDKKKNSFMTEGILKMLPTLTVNGWIFCKTGMIAVKYNENHTQIEENNISKGSAVFFECIDNKYAENIRKQPPQITNFDRNGIFEMMPSKEESGWIYSKTGMITVEYEDNIDAILAKKIFVGTPIIFCCKDNKTATNIRLQQTIRQTIVRNCLDFVSNKGDKTRYDAQYYVSNTELQFDGDLKHNSFQIPKDLSSQNIASIVEKILNAFINTEGGTIYFGINKSFKIIGVPSKDIDITQIQKSVMNVVSSYNPYFKENVIDKVKIVTVSILSKKGRLIDDLIVLKISIPGPIIDDNGNQIIFSLQNGDKYKKNLSYIVKIV